MSMTYTPSWEKKTNRWDTEPEIWEDLYSDEELENAKNADEISLEQLLENNLEDEIELDESEFDLDN